MADKLTVKIMQQDSQLPAANGTAVGRKSLFNAASTLMIQGTTSDAGKSILVTALCRILKRHGYSVAPFKSQNMALNSAVAADGGEIGRAQAVQAEACELLPSTLMNPVLLKPNSELGAQVIINGQAIGNMKADEYHQFKPKLLQTVVESHQQLLQQHQMVIVEGAGSPAEINLRQHDIANMGFAEAIDCPVIIVADIDRGGVFAHLYGTYALLSESEKSRVVGFVINRFRGDVSLLQSGLDWLKQQTSVPVLAVIPFIPNLHIEAEDSLTSSQHVTRNDQDQKLTVVVIQYPRTSNHTDFDALRLHPQVDIQFIRESGDFSGADLIILPGSKNVRGDMSWLEQQGWPDIIQRHLRFGGKVLGICGGFQMLGDAIHDPDAIESQCGSSRGLGLLAMETRLTGNKVLRNIQGQGLLSDCQVAGYEIHAGVSQGAALDSPLFRIRLSDTQVSETSPHVNDEYFDDGAHSPDHQVYGSYIHGLFDQPSTLHFLLKWSGLNMDDAENTSDFDYPAFRLQQMDRLADAVEQEISLDHLLTLVKAQ